MERIRDCCDLLDQYAFINTNVDVHGNESVENKHFAEDVSAILDQIRSLNCSNFFIFCSKDEGDEHSINDSNIDILLYADYTQIPSVTVTYIILYLAIMLLSLAGNAMVCYTVWHHKNMHTVINYYIANLAVSDILVTGFVLPFSLMEFATPPEWNFLNGPLCTALRYFQPLFVFASVLTLMATCIERYVAIVHPLEARKFNSKSRARKILALVWITPAIVATPYLQKSTVKEATFYSDLGTIRRKLCQDEMDAKMTKAFYTFLFFFIYVMPLIFISVTCLGIARVLLSQSENGNESGSLSESFRCPHRGPVNRQDESRKKVAKMVVVICVAFIIAWSPYFIITMVTTYQVNSFFDKGQFFFTMMTISLFAFINSCVNPIIYVIMSRKFRNGFYRIVTCGTLRYSEVSLSYKASSSDNNCSYVSTATVRTSSGSVKIRQSRDRKSHTDSGHDKKMAYKEWQKARYATIYCLVNTLFGRTSTTEQIELHETMGSSYHNTSPTEGRRDTDLTHEKSPGAVIHDAIIHPHITNSNLTDDKVKYSHLTSSLSSDNLTNPDDEKGVSVPRKTASLPSLQMPAKKACLLNKMSPTEAMPEKKRLNYNKPGYFEVCTKETATFSMTGKPFETAVTDTSVGQDNSAAAGDNFLNNNIQRYATSSMPISTCSNDIFSCDNALYQDDDSSSLRHLAAKEDTFSKNGKSLINRPKVEKKPFSGNKKISPISSVETKCKPCKPKTLGFSVRRIFSLPNMKKNASPLENGKLYNSCVEDVRL